MTSTNDKPRCAFVSPRRYANAHNYLYLGGVAQERDVSAALPSALPHDWPSCGLQMIDAPALIDGEADFAWSWVGSAREGLFGGLFS